MYAQSLLSLLSSGAWRFLACTFFSVMLPGTALAEEGSSSAAPQVDLQQLAKLLENPVANLISVPFQNNWDFGIGPGKATRYTLNVQPVLPFRLSSEWNLVTRTIMPFVHVYGGNAPGDRSRSGLADVTQSFFFSPTAVVDGLILGAGPVVRYPTATDSRLTGRGWGFGPTALLIQQSGRVTYGGLANHLWGTVQRGERQSLNQTFIQPIVAFQVRPTTTLSLSAEAVYDWHARQWIVPLNLGVSQMISIGQQPVRVSVVPRYYVERPPGGATWGMRLQFTFPFPK